MYTRVIDGLVLKVYIETPNSYIVLDAPIVSHRRPSLDRHIRTQYNVSIRKGLLFNEVEKELNPFRSISHVEMCFIGQGWDYGRKSMVGLYACTDLLYVYPLVDEWSLTLPSWNGVFHSLGDMY